MLLLISHAFLGGRIGAEMNWNLYEHERMKELKLKHTEWIWNRGDTHVILGEPGSPEAFKTPVEPGNSFSPGPGTYGVSSWIYTDGMLHTPEERPLEELEWSFEQGFIPVLKATWEAGNVRIESKLFTEKEEECYQDYYTVTLTNLGEAQCKADFYLVIRSFGASGGPIGSLKGEKGTILINGAKMVVCEEDFDGFGAVSYEKSKEDISVFLKRGELPKEKEIEDPSTWASGAARYEMKLNRGESRTLSFGFLLHRDKELNDWKEEWGRPLGIEEKCRDFSERWRSSFKIRLNLPDRRYSDAMLCQLTHLYMFTVDHSVRITPVSYPLWWLRDGAYVLNALNRGGFHEFAKKACREIAKKDAFGGFGSEGDGPSDGIWILSEHYLLTRDKEYLREIYPHIERKGRLLMEMRRTAKPMRLFTEFVIPKCMLDPNSDLLCLPAENHLIMGRMDHGIRPYWINSFAYMALKRAAFCAEELGKDGSIFDREAEEIKEALLLRAEEEFGKDDRDVNSAFWPGGWADRENVLLLNRFEEFWNRVRCPGGIHAPEKEWTYFEAGQAHNFMLLGDREKAWVSIEWFLVNHTAPGLYTYGEAIDGNTALLWPRTRGWDDIEFVTPHGWTAAEVFHLLRDGLIRELEGELVIGSGVPENWKEKDFSVEMIPTYYGTFSFWYEANNKTLQYKKQAGMEVTIRHELPFEAELIEC